MNCLSAFFAMSMHLGLQGDYNGYHPHVRCQVDSVISGVYYNSEKEISAYVGHRWEKHNCGIEVGVVSGYSIAPVVPFVRATFHDFFVMPAFEEEDNNIGAVFGYEFKWNPRKIPKPPKAWINTYPGTEFNVINQDNYLSWVRNK